MLWYFFYRTIDKSLSVSAKRKLNRLYYDQLLDCMREPQQCDFSFEPHRTEDPHNHEGDLGTEKRSAAVRDCKLMAREQPFESAGDVIDTALAKLSIDPGVKPVDVNNLARCLLRERAALFPKIDFTDPEYKVKLESLLGKNISYPIVASLFCFY